MPPSAHTFFLFRVGPYALIALFGLLAYSNSFSVPFVYDDLGNIVHNPSLRSFDFLNWRSYFDLRSLPPATFALQVRLGLDKLWHLHAVSVAVHISTACLIYWLSLALGSRFTLTNSSPDFQSVVTQNLTRPQKPRLALAEKHEKTFADEVVAILPALFAALLFVTHPIATEAVTYLVQRSVSLTTLFYVSAIVSYVRWRTEPKGKIFWAVASLVMTLLAMHSKQIAVTLPVIIFLVEVLFFARSLPRAARISWPWLLLALYIPWRMFGLPDFFPGAQTAPTVALDVTGNVDAAAAVASGATPLSATSYFLTQLGVLLTYLRLLILPVGQSVDHDFIVINSLYTPIVLISSLLLVCMLAGAWFARRRYPVATLGICWFFVTLAPESTVFPLLEVVAEYRTYLPIVGFALIAAAVAQYLQTRVERTYFVPSILLLVIVLLTGLTWQRNSVWRDPELLWRDAALKAPRHARPHNNLGVVLLEKGQTKFAVQEFEQAVALSPMYAHAYNNLGTAQAQLGRRSEAITAYQRAYELDPDLLSAALNLATLYLQQEKLPEARVLLEEVLSRASTPSARTYTLLGVVHLQQNDLPQARAQFEAALAIDPAFESARNNLALVRDLLGD